MRAIERASDRAIHAYTRETRVKRVKCRFPKNTYKPTISDVQTTLKHEDVSMPILKIGPGQDLATELQQNVAKLSKAFDMCYLPGRPQVLLPYYHRIIRGHGDQQTGPSG